MQLTWTLFSEAQADAPIALDEHTSAKQKVALYVKRAVVFQWYQRVASFLHEQPKVAAMLPFVARALTRTLERTDQPQAIMDLAREVRIQRWWRGGRRGGGEEEAGRGREEEEKGEGEGGGRWPG